MAFLAAAPAGARGFWQRGGHWIAHAGVAGEVQVAHRRAGERFAAVRRAAARLLAGPGAEVEGGAGSGAGAAAGAGEDPPPRLYGGFSFGDLPSGSPEPADGWRPPPARFVLPELELERHGETTVLRATASRLPHQTRNDVEELLQRRLEGLLGALVSGAEAPLEDLPVGGSGTGPAGSAPRMRPLTESREWSRSVQRVLGRIRRTEVQKVVLARAVEVHFAGAVEPLRILDRLRRANPRAWPFLFETAAGSTVIGAAPELLVAVRDGRFHTMAVAGTAGRGEVPEEDRRLARRLVESEKDGAEHGIGVRELGERLRDLVRDFRVDPAPRVLRLAGVHHLRTDVRGRLPEGMDVLSLVETLHPTAAICGYPREAAGEVLQAEEPVERGWYGGPVGWLDARGDGVFAPALRSAVLRGRVARLHAGAGIVAGSRPSAEWQETGMKLRTVLDALDIPGA